MRYRCVRNSFKYVNYSDLKKFSSDFKAVYNAPNEKAGLDALADIRDKWGRKYPYAVMLRISLYPSVVTPSTT